MHIQNTNRSDASDTKAKKAAVMRLVENEQIAIKAANQIKLNPQLLDGLGNVVVKLAKVEAAAQILDKVFEKHARDYPRTYADYVRARLS